MTQKIRPLKFRGIGLTSNDGTRFCVMCGNPLDAAKTVWLEADTGFHRFYAVEDEALSESESMGCFEFGPKCAAKALAYTKQIDNRH